MSLPLEASASEAIAVLSELGCFPMQVLQLGPFGGAFQCQYVVHELFSLSPKLPRWFETNEKGYLNDFTPRSSRASGGRLLGDREYDAELRAARAPEQRSQERELVESYAPTGAAAFIAAASDQSLLPAEATSVRSELQVRLLYLRMPIG